MSLREFATRTTEDGKLLARERQASLQVTVRQRVFHNNLAVAGKWKRRKRKAGTES